MSAIRRQKEKIQFLKKEKKTKNVLLINTDFDSSEESDSDDDNESHDDVDRDDKPVDQYEVTTIVTEFLHKLFPGRTIFTKEKNILEIIFLNHDYFRMFVGSELAQTRVIRFLNVVAVVLVCIFVDTIFFGIFFPSTSTCTLMTTKVTLTALS